MKTKTTKRPVSRSQGGCPSPAPEVVADVLQHLSDSPNGVVNPANTDDGNTSSFATPPTIPTTLPETPPCAASTQPCCP